MINGRGARELGLAGGTVRRFARATSGEDLLANHVPDGRASSTPFIDHLHTRWNAGRTNVTELLAEPRELGHQGALS